MHGDNRGAIDILTPENSIALSASSVSTLCDALSLARRNKHRLLLCLSGSPAWCSKVAQRLYTQAESGVWVGDTSCCETEGSAPDIFSIQPQQAKQLLGSEYGLVVLNAHSGLSPDMLAAVSGTVLAGGALVLLTPPWMLWGVQPDPDYTRLASYPNHWQTLPAYFLARLRATLDEHMRSDAVCLHWYEEVDGLQPDDVQHPEIIFPSIKKSMDYLIPNDEQLSCLHQLNSFSGVSVLLADRGCGKSATLGFAARQWLQEKKSVLLVAPSRAAAASVFRHADASLPFSAPDALLSHPVDIDILLIDEAAGLPLPLLLALLERYPRIVMATTIDGYEGTGRGFVLRFLRELDRRCVRWQSLRLEQPVRWAKDDGLSRWLYQSLLLDAVEPALPTMTDIGVESVVFETLSQEQLAKNNDVLSQVYGLLRSAHYRTTPDDLRFLLDAPAISVYRLAANACTLAVALVVEEGGLDSEMAREVANGHRRPRGHLLVQTLAVHLQRAEFLQQRVARIVRIAVHTQCQSQGLGSLLLQAIVQRKKEESLAAIGSSFSAAPEVVNFWQKNGFLLLRMGHRRQAASAEPSALVLKELS